MARRLTPLLLAAALGLPAGPARAVTPSCADGAVSAPVVGLVAEASCDSPALGGTTPFSYYVPPECTVDSRCPVLYLLHGFGGTYRSDIAPGGNGSVWVRALTSDPLTGAPRDRLSFIFVAPHGRTVAPAGPDNPPADVESFYVDWNPRYWKRPPRFEEHITREFVGLVDRSFPTIATREGRAIAGISLGGFGAFKLAFQHPDLYVTAGSISGALNILVAPDVQPLGPGRPGIGGAPLDTTYVRGPRVITTPPGFPFGDPFGAFGDPVADEAYFRGNNPLDLALNATGVGLRFFHNDTVPRDPSDFANFPSYAGAQALEGVVFPMNAEMRLALTQLGIPFEYELHPGLHSGRYWDPYIRSQLEWQYARVSRPGEPLEPSTPESFDYRSIRDHFSIWGWDVRVEGRGPEEFLTLWDVSPYGVSLTGSGTVTITTPDFGEITGVCVIGPRAPGGSITGGPHGATVTFTFGPQQPTDEHAGASGIPGVQNTVRIGFAYPGQNPAC